MDKSSDIAFIINNFPLRFEPEDHILSIPCASKFVKEGSIKILLFDLVDSCPLTPHDLLLFVDLLVCTRRACSLLNSSRVSSLSSWLLSTVISFLVLRTDPKDFPPKPA